MKTVERFPPSVLEHVAACPGWIPEEYQTATGAADEGKLMHKALESGQLKGLNEEQILCVSKVQKVIAREKSMLEGVVTEHRELFVEIEDFNRGVIDYLGITNTRALIVDAKFGRREVEDAEKNLQGICYVVAIFQRHPKIESIRVVFAQPRCDMVSSAEFTVSQLGALLLELKKVRANVKLFSETQRVDLLRPSERNCAYCGNLAVCPKVNNAALVVAQGYDLTHEKEIQDLFDPSQLATPERRAQAEKLRRVLEKWCSSVQKHNLQARLAGEEIPGYELKHRTTERRITEPVIAWEVAQELTENQLTNDDLMACSSLNLKALEDVVKTKFKRGQKAKAKLRLEEELIDRDAINLGTETRFLQKIK